MSEATDLKPCPFCGGEARMTKTNHETWVECSNYHWKWHQVCAHAATETEAIEAWNTRAEINGQEKRVRELESLVRDYHECGRHECNDSCPHRRTGTRQFCDFGPAGWWNDRIAELGIEVDE